MPRIEFGSLPDSARVWVFAAERPVTGTAAARLRGEVEEFLDGWKAHGEPLRAAYDWRDDHFLTIGVDPTTANASGCSIDGLFRRLREVQAEIGTTLLSGGKVFYREPNGTVACTSRDGFAELATAKAVGPNTVVFDTTLTSAGDWRQRFETEVGRSWHAQLIPANVR